MAHVVFFNAWPMLLSLMHCCCYIGFAPQKDVAALKKKVVYGSKTKKAKKPPHSSGEEMGG